MNRREFLLLLNSTVTAPSALHAQQKALPVIGYLSLASPGPFATSLAAFRQGLGEIGYVEGQSVSIEYRWAEGQYDRLPALAADLVARKVDVIVAERRRRAGAGCKKRDLDDPDRLHRRRPGCGRPRGQSRPTGRQPHGHDLHGGRANA